MITVNPEKMLCERHMSSTLFALLVLGLLSGVFTSCDKYYKSTTYRIEFIMEEYTQPQSISDPEVRQAYDQIIDELEKMNVGFDAWTVEIVNDRFEDEDKNAETRYNNALTRVKAAEAQCRQIIDALGTEYESSFYIRAVVKLSRWVAVDHLSTLMGEYHFELKYN